MNPLRIGKYVIEKPIVQGGMGVGISWDKLAGNVSKEGGLGVVSAVGTGYYEDGKHAKLSKTGRPVEAENFYCSEATKEIIKNARKICADKPLAVNILYASCDYGNIVKDVCEAGINIIITGAGLPTNMPEFAADYPDVALVPIVSSAKALKIICKRWARYDKVPDAVIIEGPKSGGHQGFTYEQCSQEEYQLENIVPPIIEEAKKWGDFPLIAAGGIWDKNDIDKFLDMGCSGVQMATRFIGTFECDAHENLKNVLVNANEEDIKLIKSPVGLPARGVITNLQKSIENGTASKIACISNCVAPCKRGEEARAVGYCIADSLSDAYMGNLDTGLFFTGTNGYKLDKLISVKELMDKLRSGRFITLETTPTLSAKIDGLISKLDESEAYKYVDGFTTTDSPLAKLKYSSLFGAVKIQEKFNKPVIATVSMRDKNKIALQSDLLGANDFNIRTILALTGDSAKASDQPNTKGVFEGDSSLLLEIVNCFNSGINYAGKPFKDDERPETIYPFSVINSFAKNPKTLLKKMIKKIENHSVGLISQPVYSVEQAKNLIEIFNEAKRSCKCSDPQAQLILGYFPITRFRTAQFLSAHVPGIDVPIEWLDSLRFASNESEEDEERVGMEMSQKLFNDLLELHPKIHVMTANKFELAKEIISKSIGQENG